MRKPLLACASALSILGCQQSIVDPSATGGVTATLGAATYASGQKALTASTTATLRLTFAGAATTSLVDAVGSTSTPPAGLFVTTTGGAACPTVALVAAGPGGAVVLITGCTGDGSVTVGVNAAVARSGTSAANSASSTRTVLVQNTRPTATTSLAQTTVNSSAGANVMTATFAGLITPLSPTNAGGEVTVTGCSTPPTPSIVTTTVGANSVATVSLTGGTCANGTTVTVTLNLDHVTNLAGTAGLSSANPTPLTYAVSATGVPTGTLAAAAYPGSQTALRSGQTATFALTWAGATAQSLTTTVGTSASPPSGLSASATGTASCADLHAQTPTTTGATLSVGSCGGDGTIQVGVGAGVASNANGSNAAPTARTIRVYTAAPTVQSVNAPASAGGSDGAATVTFTFSQLMSALNGLGSNFTITGCSTTDPGASVAMSDDGAGHSIATLTLGGGVCTSGDTVSVTLSITSVSNGAGIAGDPAYTPPVAAYAIP